MMRVTINLPDTLRRRCEKDAEEMRVSLSMYFRRLAEDRHGLVKLSTKPPRVSELEPFEQVAAVAGSCEREIQDMKQCPAYPSCGCGRVRQ